MNRVAFTIIFNGLHHLKHNDYYKFILDNFDHWVIAEGAVQSNGSTSWCKTMPLWCHDNGRSIDGTLKFLEDLSKTNSNLSLITKNGFWNSKDEQVNGCITELKKYYDNGYLWQIDCDEQWSLENLERAETLLEQENLKTACFPARSWLGKNLLAKGEWGECIRDGYRRLWKWQGEQFQTHEPPLLDGINDPMKMLPIYFDHYNYYFEKDVAFKDIWYSGHEGILENWKMLQTLPKEVFPLDIKNFFSHGWNAMTDTKIVHGV